MALEGSSSPNNLAPVNFNDPTQPYSPSFQCPFDIGKYDRALGNKSYTIQRQGDIIQHSMKLLIESGEPSKNEQSDENDLVSSVYAANNVQLVLRPQKDSLIEQASLFQSQVDSLSNENHKLAGIVSNASVITNTYEHDPGHIQVILDTPKELVTSGSERNYQ